MGPNKLSICISGNAIASSKQIFASCPVADSYLLDGFKNLGCQTLHDNKELVDSTDIVILAVKPNIVPFVLSETKTLFGENKTLVSIAAGIKIAQLQNNLMDKSKVSRVAFDSA